MFLAILLAVSCSYGQEAKLEKAKTVFSAKLYAVSTFQDLGNNSYFGGPIIQLPRSFSPTINWGKEYGNFHEVELTDFKFSSGRFNRLFAVGSRYSYNWRLFSKSETSKFNYFIGFIP